VAAVDHGRRPVDPPGAVQRLQQHAVQALEDPRLLPGRQAPVRGRRRATHLARQVSPGDAGEQHEDDRVEADTVVDPRTAALGTSNLQHSAGTLLYDDIVTAHIAAESYPWQLVHADMIADNTS